MRIDLPHNDIFFCMKHIIRNFLDPILIVIGLFFSFPAVFSQDKILKLDLEKGFDTAPVFRSVEQKVVTSIEYYSTQWDEWEGTAMFEYDHSGRVSRMSVKGNMGHMIQDGIYSYVTKGNELRVFESTQNGDILVRLCQLSDMGYVVRETGVPGHWAEDDVFTYTYDNKGQITSASFNYNGGVNVHYTWQNGNVLSSREENTYTDIPNKANINFNALWREFYSEDNFGLALGGYIGNKDAYLLATGEKADYDYDFDDEGYPTVIYETYDDVDYYLVINYGNATIYDPNPTPDPTPDDPSHPTNEEELKEAIDQAPEGTEGSPTEIFIPSGGISLKDPIDIDKHIRLKGGLLKRGNNHSYALLRIREGFSLDLDGVTIDGEGSSLKDGTLVVYGKLRLREGTMLRNCYRVEVGSPSGAICIGTNGYVRMDRGAKICRNTGTYGSAVYCEGKFEMYDGEISGNQGQIGAVVVNAGGSFIMHGGKISGNKVTEGCGGVFVGENSQFILNAGEISGNDDCDIYSWADITLGSNGNVKGLTLLTGGNSLKITDRLKNNWTVAFVDNPQSGTVVAKGDNFYRLSNSDLQHIHYAENAYSLKLDGNTIVVERTTTAIENIHIVRVYTQDGLICVDTPNLEEVTIVTMAGMVVKNEEQIGLKQYHGLQPGIYVVRIGEKAYKIRLN